MPGCPLRQCTAVHRLLPCPEGGCADRDQVLSRGCSGKATLVTVTSRTCNPYDGPAKDGGLRPLSSSVWRWLTSCRTRILNVTRLYPPDFDESHSMTGHHVQAVRDRVLKDHPTLSIPQKLPRFPFGAPCLSCRNAKIPSRHLEYCADHHFREPAPLQPLTTREATTETHDFPTLWIVPQTLSAPTPRLNTLAALSLRASKNQPPGTARKRTLFSALLWRWHFSAVTPGANHIILHAFCHPISISCDFQLIGPDRKHRVANDFLRIRVPWTLMEGSESSLRKRHEPSLTRGEKRHRGY